MYKKNADIFKRTLEHDVILFQAGLKCQRPAEP